MAQVGVKRVLLYAIGSSIGVLLFQSITCTGFLATPVFFSAVSLGVKQSVLLLPSEMQPSFP